MANTIPMGFNFGLESPTQCWKRKFRWLFSIETTTKQFTVSVPVLPPRKSSRPNLSFKEIEVQHLTESIYFPGKPSWKPIPLSLYDLKSDANPVFEWIEAAYEVDAGEWRPSIQPTSSGRDSLKRKGYLTLYDGCGAAIEQWVYENVWPQQVNWGELEMGNSEIITVDMTLRYDRAYENVPIADKVRV